MFDIGFWELLLIAVLGLLVLGPERLPRVARSMGIWAGRARAYVRQLSRELDREIQADELRRQMQEGQASLNTLRDNLNAPLEDAVDHGPTPPSGNNKTKD